MRGREKDAHHYSAALGRSADLTSTGTSLTSTPSPRDLVDSAERAKEAWSELRGLMPNVMRARGEVKLAKGEAAPPAASPSGDPHPPARADHNGSLGGPGLVGTGGRRGSRPLSNSSPPRKSSHNVMIDHLDDGQQRKPARSRGSSRASSPGGSVSPVGRMSPGGALRKASSPLRELIASPSLALSQNLALPLA